MNTRAEIPSELCCVRSLRQLAAIIGVQLPILRQLALNASSLYREGQHFDKKRQKVIKKEVPLAELKDVQSRIVKRLLNRIVSCSPLSYGAVKGRSPLNAAQLHVNKDLVATVDIRDFFRHVTYKHVYRAFRSLRYSDRVSQLLARLTTRKNRLPKGSPSSPAISNLVMMQVDAQIVEDASRRGVSVSRFIDDIAHSGQKEDILPLVEACIRRLHGMGFPVHREQREKDGKRPKLRFQHKGQRQEVLSLIVNHDTPVVPKNYCREVRSAIRLKIRTGATIREMNSLRGRIAYVRTTNPNRAAALEDQLSSITIIH